MDKGKWNGGDLPSSGEGDWKKAEGGKSLVRPRNEEAELMKRSRRCKAPKPDGHETAS